jgi:hypothetical protein
MRTFIQNARGDAMTIDFTAVWRRYQVMEEEFNRRQMAGEPCADLVTSMIKEISPAIHLAFLPMTRKRGNLRAP